MPRTPQEAQQQQMNDVARKHATSMYTAVLQKYQTDPAMTNKRQPTKNSVDHGELTNSLDGYITDTRSVAKQGVNDAATAQSTADHALNVAKSITGTDSALSGSNRHSHSISSTPFIKLPRLVRLMMLMDRLELEQLVEGGLGGRIQMMFARNTLNLLRLFMDYEDFDAFERERRFDDPGWSEWAQAYKRIYGVDEFSESDRQHFLSYGTLRMDPYAGIVASEDA